MEGGNRRQSDNLDYRLKSMDKNCNSKGSNQKMKFSRLLQSPFYAHLTIKQITLTLLRDKNSLPLFIVFDLPKRDGTSNFSYS